MLHAQFRDEQRQQSNYSGASTHCSLCRGDDTHKKEGEHTSDCCLQDLARSIQNVCLRPPAGRLPAELEQKVHVRLRESCDSLWAWEVISRNLAITLLKPSPVLRIERAAGERAQRARRPSLSWAARRVRRTHCARY